MGEIEQPSPMTISTASGEASASSSQELQAIPQESVATKKKRNLPGMPDPNAEVIALSPKTLMATNRFVCEICNKGFQRDQNLQLHRRGHNLPWKLRQRTTKEIRKRVYVCPEPSCVHHDPSRALGDLTGIKKHFCRKHGEKKWKCDKCSKKYAVQSDWKAHMKTCGTKEYRCDCGTLFSRRDSFITHRAFCDALAEESARATQPNLSNKPFTGVEESADPVPPASSPLPPPPPLSVPPSSDSASPVVADAATTSTALISPAVSLQNSDLAENQIGVVHQQAQTQTQSARCTSSTSNTSSSSNSSTSSTVFASLFASSAPAVQSHSQSSQASSSFSDLLCAMARSNRTATEPTSLSLASSLYLSNPPSSLFPTPDQDHRRFAPPPQPTMSATALLQKAAEMGAAASKASLLCGFGLSMSPSSSQQNNSTTTSSTAQWIGQIKQESTAEPAMLGLGLPSDGLTDLMMGPMGPSSLFGSNPTTLDLLGLSLGVGSATSNGISALLTAAAAASTYGGGNPPEKTWEAAPDMKPNRPELL
ncbi:Zinc finger C2H2-type [Dillenia turbinata]|uniref:Zinc finger C2H2-type n=1 Tax=Dillenia turbinata TaxID=194707 RepID=A0AAN8ZLP9_9MAGN